MTTADTQKSYQQHRKNVWLLISPRYCLIGAIVLYQKVISPLLGSRCRYYPSCSTYAREALSQCGLFRGSALTMWRIVRCNPFSDGGFDPVKSPSGMKKSLLNSISHLLSKHEPNY